MTVWSVQCRHLSQKGAGANSSGRLLCDLGNAGGHELLAGLGQVASGVLRTDMQFVKHMDEMEAPLFICARRMASCRPWRAVALSSRGTRMRSQHQISWGYGHPAAQVKSFA